MLGQARPTVLRQQLLVWGGRSSASHGQGSHISSYALGGRSVNAFSGCHEASPVLSSFGAKGAW